MRVGLFVTCLVDLMRPSIGMAALKLLEDAGCEVTVPAMQTCCGQPGWNSGDRKSARSLAEKLIAEFDDCRYVELGDQLLGERSEEHTSELQSLTNLVCRLLLEKKKKKQLNLHESKHRTRPNRS